jgi:hypothetical protein
MQEISVTYAKMTLHWSPTVVPPCSRALDFWGKGKGSRDYEYQEGGGDK